MPAPFEGKTAILLEDQMIELFKAQLESIGFSVLAFRSHAEMVAANPPKADILIFDNHLYSFDAEKGYVDDIETVEWMRDDPWLKADENPNKDTPILFNTDSSKTERRMMQALDLEMSGFLWKSMSIHPGFEDGILAARQGQEVLRATMESHQEGKLIVTQGWREIFENTIADSTITMTDYDDEIPTHPDDLYHMEKLLPEEATRLSDALVTPQEVGISTWGQLAKEELKKRNQSDGTPGGNL
jgi:CheY-like chemotaxis protein